MKKAAERVFLIGAGFTKAAFPHAPLNKDVLKSLSDPEYATVAKYRELYKEDDIEKLLTRLDLDAMASCELKAERARIDSELSAYFSRFRFTDLTSSPHWLGQFCMRLLQKNDCIINLNYDCLLDGALDSFGVWSPNGGYAGIGNQLADSLPANPLNIKIYKIHGSENFYQSSVLGRNPRQTGIGLDINPFIYPKSGAHSYLRFGMSNSKPYIIAPSFVKIPHVDIAAMMLDLLEEVGASRDFVIIGCGLRPEDSFLWLVLTRFLNSCTLPKRRLLILDPDAEALWRRISDYWVDDINEFADVSVLPYGIEQGIQQLRKALNIT
jgi:hypothetical protein